MKPKTKTLKNGLRTIVVPTKDNPTVTVLVLVAAGSKYETRDINGLSHFLEHMCFKGTEKRPQGIQIARELDGIGAQYNAFTGQEYTGYYAKAEAKHFPKLLDVISDVYLHSTFPEPELEREKGVILDEINMYEDLPMRKVADIWMELLYGNQPAGWTILGLPENIKNATRQQFVDYRKKHYVASGTTVVVAGNIAPQKVFKAIDEAFASISTAKKHTKKKVIQKQSKPAVALRYKQTDQTHLILGVRTEKLSHKDTVVLNVLASLLGGGMSSRLFDRLREKMGVGYYVRAEHDAYTDHGYLGVSTGVTNERAAEVVAAIMDELRRIRDEKISDHELRKVKQYMVGNMYLGLESTDALAELYGFQSVLDRPIQTPREIAKKVQAVTAADLARVAKRICTNERLNLALIGPFKDAKKFSKILKF